MNDFEELKDLIGHTVTLDIQIGYDDDPFYTGILEEVGGNYIAIRPSYSAKESSEAEEQLSIKLDAASIAHARGYCESCDTKPITNPVVNSK